MTIIEDLALIAHAATLESRVPFLHFFGGFRTSHEMAKIAAISDEQMRGMIDPELVLDHRERALTPDRAVLKTRLRRAELMARMHNLDATDDQQLLAMADPSSARSKSSFERRIASISS